MSAAEQAVIDIYAKAEQQEEGRAQFSHRLFWEACRQQHPGAPSFGDTRRRIDEDITEEKRAAEEEAATRRREEEAAAAQRQADEAQAAQYAQHAGSSGNRALAREQADDRERWGQHEEDNINQQLGPQEGR